MYALKAVSTYASQSNLWPCPRVTMTCMSDEDIRQPEMLRRPTLLTAVASSRDVAAPHRDISGASTEWSYAVPAPVVEYTLAVTDAVPAPVDVFIAPAASYVASAPVVESCAPAVSYTAPTPVVEFTAPAPSVLRSSCGRRGVVGLLRTVLRCFCARG